MADMRERLIELLKDTLHEWECDVQPETLSQIADHLIKNGVIVLPCKVGDTVYFDCCGYHDSAEIDGIHIDAQGISFTWVQYDVGVDITELWNEGEFDLDDIGKTVFLTREEAEQALKEREEE